jgi:hypothetical protein
LIQYQVLVGWLGDNILLLGKNNMYTSQKGKHLISTLQKTLQSLPPTFRHFAFMLQRYTSEEKNLGLHVIGRCNASNVLWD